jgi:hypothetical protein
MQNNQNKLHDSFIDYFIIDELFPFVSCYFYSGIELTIKMMGINRI